jgi:hypothetical protein
VKTVRFVFLVLLCSVLAMRITPAAASTANSCDSTGLGPSDEDNAYVVPGFTGFGTDVAISGDTAIVGLPNYVNEAVEPRQSGRVAVFTCDPQTHSWSRTGSLDPSNQTLDETSFGRAVELQERTAVVSAENTIFIYEKVHGDWRLVRKLAPKSDDEFLESSIVYDQPYLAVTVAKVDQDAGQVTRHVAVYRVDGGARVRLVARLRPPEFGDGLALDGDTLVAGLDVYSRRHGTWRLQQRLALSGAPSGDWPGGGMDIHRDTLLVGNPAEDEIRDETGPSNGGAVYVFQRRHGAWREVQRIRPDYAGLFNGFGRSLAFNGRYAVIGAPTPYGNYGRDFGPTFVYRMSEQGLQFDRTLGIQNAVTIDISRRHAIIGRDIIIQNAPFSSADIIRLAPLPEAEEVDDGAVVGADER